MTPRRLIVPILIVACHSAGQPATRPRPNLRPLAGIFPNRLRVRRTGAEAIPSRALTVHYTGWLYNPSNPDGKGTHFDTSIGKVPFAFTLGSTGVISDGTARSRACGSAVSAGSCCRRSWLTDRRAVPPPSGRMPRWSSKSSCSLFNRRFFQPSAKEPAGQGEGRREKGERGRSPDHAHTADTSTGASAVSVFIDASFQRAYDPSVLTHFADSARWVSARPHRTSVRPAARST